MPKKTKKQKLLATYHRKTRLLENQQVINTPEMPASPVEIKIKTPINKPLSQESMNSNQYFFSDLKKSLLLIVLILGLEVSLYFAKLIK
ncbi:MAG: hypothetical protein ACD_12C00634G0001 [uncultured bacterium]|nr:MAG: hypothetical protein ACD_12C00634G0001 [uncultured bacterium]